MLTAITRGVSPAMINCELTFMARAPIHLAKAREQHRAYEEALEKFGAEIICLPAEPALADSVFVEDPAMVLDELALIFPLGTESRRAEAASLANVLSRFRELKYVQLPGTAEGGDILRVGHNLFAGLSKRTNEDGIRQLQSIVGEYGYTVTAVPVSGCLHLKSAVTFLGRNTLLANRKWFAASCMQDFEWIDVAPEEPHAANALAFGDTVILPASFPLTRERIQARGFTVLPLDISELQKAESGLTCSSLLFDAKPRLGQKETAS
jgi:dimethylargininase